MMGTLRYWFLRHFFPGWLLLVSCGASQHAPECDGVRREELTAVLIAELVACENQIETQPAYQACIDKAEARHTARRKGWVACE